MIDLYTSPTPNGWKAAMMLEELALDYVVKHVDLAAGDQHKPEFLEMNPNGRIPVIVDHEADGLTVFDSNAILFYLAEKTNRFIPADSRGRIQALEWLFWQTGNQGPMAGQLSHVVNYAPGEHPYSHTRYANEYDRCVGVLERQLDGRAYILGDDYSVADIIAWPWVLIAKPLRASLDAFPNITRWRKVIKERPAVQRAVALGKDFRRQGPPSDEERQLLFNQTAASTGGAAEAAKG